jgi:hypothetical protein
VLANVHIVIPVQPLPFASNVNQVEVCAMLALPRVSVPTGSAAEFVTAMSEGADEPPATIPKAGNASAVAIVAFVPVPARVIDFTGVAGSSVEIRNVAGLEPGVFGLKVTVTSMKPLGAIEAGNDGMAVTLYSPGFAPPNPSMLTVRFVAVSDVEFVIRTVLDDDSTAAFMTRTSANVMFVAGFVLMIGATALPLITNTPFAMRPLRSVTVH